MAATRKHKKTNKQSAFHRTQIARAQKLMRTRFAEKLSEDQIELRKGFSIDKYLNNPETTPEEDLLTELLVPVK